MRTIAATILTMIACAGVFAQGETLTNGDIIELTKAGLPPDIVIQKIRTSNTRFDTTTAALVELKKANVDDQVIALMIERQNLKPANVRPDNTPAFSESGSTPNATTAVSQIPATGREALQTARTIAIVKSSLQPSRQALEKELMKRPEFQAAGLTIERYRDTADLYVEIGFVHFSWLTHRYVYRIYDRRSGAVLAAGETTSWGSLAENLARNIAKSLKKV